MSRKVIARKTGARATVWLWDWMSLAAASLTIYPIAARVVAGHIPLFWVLLAALVGSTFITHRIRITREHPTTGTATTFLFLVPVSRRQFDLVELRASRSDDWSGDVGAPCDELTTGTWSMTCADASAIAAWLREAGAELAVPKAETTR